MSHADFIARYAVPVVDPAAPYPQLHWCRRGEGKLRSMFGRGRQRIHGRRLAYLDSHFPWKRSGFRYADALALLEARPDTIFFSMYETRDSFPAPVYRLAEFPKIAPTLGVTDVYAVFLNFAGGLLGLWNDDPARPGPTDGPDISPVLRNERIRFHAALHPGGGFTATDRGLEQATQLVKAADQVLSWSPQAIGRVPGLIAIDPAVIDTRYFRYSERDFSERPLRLLFAADARHRKGLDTALAVMSLLAEEDLRLEVVGPHEAARSSVSSAEISFHGWMEPSELRELQRRCHIFVSPVRPEQAGEDDGGVTDGFPTAAAAEAMSSGCLLLSSNPDADHRVLVPEVDYLEEDATAGAFAAAVKRVLLAPDEATIVAASGAQRVRNRLDVRVGVAQRLSCMGLMRPPAGGWSLAQT
jgi:glycosyltransferase involved in cell wall biosynthesis